MSRKTTTIAAIFALAIGCDDPDRGNVSESRSAREYAQTDEENVQRQHPANTGGTSTSQLENPQLENPQLENQGTEATGEVAAATGTDLAGDDPYAAEEHGTAQPQGTAQNQPAQNQPADDPFAQQAQAEPEPQTASNQLVTRETTGTLASTVSRVQRELRANDFEVISVVRYDRDERERAARQRAQEQQPQAQGTGLTGMREEGTAYMPGEEDVIAQGEAQQHAQRQEPAAQGQGAQGQDAMGQEAAQGVEPTTEEIGDVRLILYRRVAEEGASLDQNGIAALLEAPRQIAVFERGETVVIAYEEPVTTTSTMGEAEPVAEVLGRIIAGVVTPVENERTASADVPRTSREADLASDEVSEDMGDDRTAMRYDDEATAGDAWEAPAPGTPSTGG
jgi:hypothetical protein